MAWRHLPELQHDVINLPTLENQPRIGSDSFQLQEWALAGIYEIAKYCPGVVRLWKTGLTNKNLQREIQNYFGQFLSENLVQKELKAVGQVSGLSCVPYFKSRSMMATYAVDDLEVEIMITLPSDWPLSPPKIEGIKSVGVNSSEWRLWLFQLEQACDAPPLLANKIQNVTNVKFRSPALVFNSKFDHKLFSSLKIT